MCVLCVPPLHTVWFHRCAEEETEAICVTPWEACFLFFFIMFIYLFIYYLTILCMKLPSLLLNVWSDVNESRKIYTCGIVLMKHRWHTHWCWTGWMITIVSCTKEAFFYTHNFISLKEQYRACFFLKSCGMDPCCKCSWFRPCMVLCCIGSL